MSDAVSYTPRCDFCGYPKDANGICTNPTCGKSIVSEDTTKTEG